LLFRLQLPQAFYRANELYISAKDDGDVNTADIVDKRLQRFTVTFDWKGLEQLGKERIFSFLLPKTNKLLEDYLRKANDLKELAIGLAASPEYQMC
jgi:hypothetical protein